MCLDYLFTQKRRHVEASGWSQMDGSVWETDYEMDWLAHLTERDKDGWLADGCVDPYRKNTHIWGGIYMFPLWFIWKVNTDWLVVGLIRWLTDSLDIWYNCTCPRDCDCMCDRYKRWECLQRQACGCISNKCSDQLKRDKPTCATRFTGSAICFSIREPVQMRQIKLGTQKKSDVYGGFNDSPFK